MAALLLTAAASAFAGSVGAGAFTTALLTGAATAAGAFLDSALVGALTPTQRSTIDAGGISDLRIQTSTARLFQGVTADSASPARSSGQRGCGWRSGPRPNE